MIVQCVVGRVVTQQNGVGSAIVARAFLAESVMGRVVCTTKWYGTDRLEIAATVPGVTKTGSL